MITESEFSAAYESNFQRIVKLLTRRGALDPEEITQMAWARAWHKRHQFKGNSSITTWVITIAISQWYGTFRDGRNRFPHVSLDRITVTDSSDVPEKRRQYISYIDPHPRTPEARQLLARISNPDRTLLCETYMDGYSYDELSQQHNQTVCSIKMQVHRAKLRARAAAAGVTIN